MPTDNPMRPVEGGEHGLSGSPLAEETIEQAMARAHALRSQYFWTALKRLAALIRTALLVRHQTPRSSDAQPVRALPASSM